MKTFLLAASVALLSPYALAADPALSPDTNRLLLQSSSAFRTGICESGITWGHAFFVRAGLQASAQAWPDLLHVEFIDALNAGLPDADLFD